MPKFSENESPWLTFVQQQAAPGAPAAGLFRFFLNAANTFGLIDSAGNTYTLGAAGTNGTDGIDGLPGTDGTNGTNGVGVPAGGAVNQILKKNTAADYDTGWEDAPNTGIEDAPDDGNTYGRSNGAWEEIAGGGGLAGGVMGQVLTKQSSTLGDFGWHFPAGSGSTDPITSPLTYSADGDENGLFYYYGTKAGTQAWQNPFDANYITATSSALAHGSLDLICDRVDNSVYTQGGNATPFYMFDLGANASPFTPTGVTFQIWPDSAGSYIPGPVQVQGSADSFTWDNLGAAYQMAPTAAGQWFNWACPATKAYRYLRIVMTTTNNQGDWTFVVGELEFYGSITTPGVAGVTSQTSGKAAYFSTTFIEAWASVAAGGVWDPVPGLSVVATASAGQTVEVMCSFVIGCTGGYLSSFWRIVRNEDGKVIAAGDSTGIDQRVSSSGGTFTNYGNTDTNATINQLAVDTSALAGTNTYQLQVMQDSRGGGNPTINRSGSDADAVYTPRGSSTIRAMVIGVTSQKIAGLLQYNSFCNNTDNTLVPDLVGNNTCLLYNGPILDTDGILTDGATNYIDTGSALNGLWMWTAALRFQTASTTAASGSYYQYPSIWNLALNGEGGDGGLTLNNGVLNWWWSWIGNTDSNGTTTAPALNDNNWHTLVITANRVSGIICVYCDGVQVTTSSGTVQPYGKILGGLAQIFGNGPFLGGANGNDFTSAVVGGSYLAAKFSHYATWALPLTAAQVAALDLTSLV